jgi:glycosyltransferase involved in cell wall biosynthesis
MKVLVFLTQFHRPNGAERLAVELAEELNKREGNRADLLSMYTDDYQPGIPEAREALLARGIPSVEFLRQKVNPNPLSLIPAALRLRKILTEGEYDAVETGAWGPTTLACWATSGLRTGHLVGIHDVHTKERFNKIRHKLWRFSIRANPRTRFYSISQYTLDHWLEYSGTSPAQNRLVYNAIPKDCFEASPDRDGVREELGIPKDSLIALFVGRVQMRKGIDTALYALGPILESENLHLIYVGEALGSEGFFPGEEGLPDRMKADIETNGWTNRVHFVGRRKDVPRLMASSDVLVHPARIEGFGLVLAEALAAGLPVVASDVMGIPEVLRGTDSLMVPPEDPERLHESVLQVLHRTPKEAEEAASRGRARAGEYRIGKRIDSLVEIFREIKDR